MRNSPPPRTTKRGYHQRQYIESGLTPVEYCQLHQLPLATLHRYLKPLLRPSQPDSNFVEIPYPIRESSSNMLSLHLGLAELHFPSSLSGDELRTVLTIFKEVF